MQGHRHGTSGDRLQRRAGLRLQVTDTKAALTDLDMNLTSYAGSSISSISNCCRSSPTRQATSREIARVKRATGYPTRDYGRERDVIARRAQPTPQNLGVSPDVAETVMRLLIRSSLTTQEQASVVAHGSGQRPARAGDRRRRQDGRLVCAVPGLAGFRGRGGRSEGDALGGPEASPTGTTRP